METTQTTPVKKESVLKKPWVHSLFGIIGIFAALGIFFVVRNALATVKIDNSQIAAPVITLGPSAPGALMEVYAHEGDEVSIGAQLAKVGTQIITAQTDGIITDIKKDIGTTYTPAQAVVSMIEPAELRVVGQIEENKGLSELAVGQSATFTVDAFGSQKYYGVIDSIAPTSNKSDVVFNISDKRQEQIFDVKIRYNVQAYPELKNGMSAKVMVTVK